jgi:hypothetical protein
MNNEAKILLFDIESAPNTAFIWGLYQETTSADFVDMPWFMLCWSAKWLGSKEIMSSALVDFPKNYKKNPEDDKLILQKLWTLLDSADIVVAHNGKNFDVRKSNARFVMNDMPPPSPYKIVDTLLEARKNFFFTSNKLNDLGKYLKVGQKVETGGFKLWKQCMSGDLSAWKKMVTYCKNDIILLEKIYLKLRPFMNTHPNLNIYNNNDAPKCPKCGSDHIAKEGYSYTDVCKYQRFSCRNCNGWFRGRDNLNKKGK